MYPRKGFCFGTFVRDQVKSMEKRGVVVDKVVKRTKNPLGYFSFLSLSIYKLLFSKYDIVHAHYVPHSALIPAMIKRKPFIVRFHGDDARIFPWKNRMNYSLVKFVTNRADKVISVSEEMKGILVNRLGADSSKVEVISSGIDTHSFIPMDREQMRNELDLPMEKKIVLFVGRLHKLKGLDLTYECAKQTPDILYVFIGRKDGEQVATYENCLFAGEIPRNDIPKWMNAADILVLPSYTEGLPNVVVESLSCGIPAVVSDVGGCPEVVKDGVTGFVVRTGDAEQLREKIVFLLSDDSLRYNMGIEGRKDVVERYDHDRLMDKLEKVYQSLMS
ncbi:glycosyltransferase family 4 protein [Methanolobus psychrotolerans]|uniref:glycosyltransferase family 4 protein n=1 Tax=Methanolobus psychrotolerans TaxID=1874706 RepID=UPI000B91A60C|nr:glycosyltransferase family 4 protein [Methanolobus psychrotolerans]